MPPGRPPGSHGVNSGVRVRDLLLLSLFAPIAAALQKQPQQYQPNGGVVTAQPWRSTAATADAPHTAVGDGNTYNNHRHHQSNNNNNNDKNARNSRSNERALATVSPAESNHPAVGAPPVPWTSAATSAGLTTRQPARSLQDWQVEDIMLLATVDGKLHARDRKTGAPKWVLETDREMVETVRHRSNKTQNEDGVEQEDPVFIVEPSQDGIVYIQAPGFRLQRLGYTVKQLADMSPYAGEGYPSVAYTAEKKNTLYTVDVATGNILKTFSSAGSLVNEEDRSCRRVDPLGALDDDACEARGTLTLGRTEYTIGIQDRNTGEPINTVRYFEWGPNNRDHDLRSKYTRTMDKRYVYPKYDGKILGVDLNKGTRYKPVPEKPSYIQTFSSPVVRVFDIVRPNGDLSSDTSLVILPQPAGPPPNELAPLEDDDSVFVNRTEAGSWYALSEAKYPSITDRAPDANGVCNVDCFTNNKFMGVHHLSPLDSEGHGTRLVDGRNVLTIDSPPVDQFPADANVEPFFPHETRTETHLTMWSFVLMLLVGLSGCGFVYKQHGLEGFKIRHLPLSTPEILIPAAEKLDATIGLGSSAPETTMIREGEPAKEIIFPQEDKLTQVRFEEPAKEVDPEESPEPDAQGDEPLAGENGGKSPKKRATRGKRAGRKQKEKEQANLEARAKKLGLPVPLAPSTQLTQVTPLTQQIAQPAQIISVAASESPQVSGPLQINNLIIHTDKVIGNGSCGTIVFEGNFEGRNVAVKRMLSQYYELASQEVSFLQQSDDHMNVVRYFCQQKDDHFLYIAVELCQASLFEVWEADKAKTEERYQQMQSLKLAIQQDMTRTLQQLAAGLHHLHNLRIIHRDIKPQNILVAFPKKTQTGGSGMRLVISDFGLGKNLPENASTLVDPTGNAGTSGWKAPELISQPRENEGRHSQTTPTNSDSGVAVGGMGGVKRAADIFSLGCLFFWVLTDGVHPFEDENGWQQLRELNIKRDKKNMDALSRWSDAYEPMQLISSMLEYLPENRPTAQAVLNHPYFWTPDKRLAFLCDVSDHFEREPRGTYDDGYAGDSQSLCALESRAEEVIGAPFDRADFLSKLDRHFVDTLGKQRKYSGNRLLDLLRALRNKKNHYEDMPPNVKKLVGPLAGGYLSYWCHRFPRLLMACHEVVHEEKLAGNDRFKGYFGLGKE